MLDMPRHLDSRERSAFWEHLETRMKQRGYPLPPNARWLGQPSARQLDIPSGLPAVHYAYALYRDGPATYPLVRVDIYDWRHRPRNELIYETLASRQAAINEEFGEKGNALEWRPVGHRPNFLGAEIVYRACAADLWQGNWQRLQDEMIDAMRRIQTVFQPRIDQLSGEGV